MADDIKQWLDSLDLAKYVHVFVESEVDLRDLPHLTDGDLKELGLPLGPRKRVMGAIAALRDAEPEADAPATFSERRQVTVLFADISGYTALSERLGAEAIHELLGEFFAMADAAIVSYGGTIDKHIGDAVMAVFGAPVAHTDDPERAVRAAMDLHGAAAALTPPLRIHVGIASGQVVASRMGSESYREYTVTGESVNLASRLTDLAAPGETLASATVARSLAERIEGAPLGPRMIEGLPEPIEVWRLDRMPDEAVIVTTAYVGRAEERKRFDEAIERCRTSGCGETILVRGEQGIGKTRLLHEFDRAARERGFNVCTGTVLDFGTGKGQDAIGSLVRGLLGESANDAEGGILSDERRVYLNDLLDLPQPDDLRALFEAMDNEVRNRGKRETLTELVTRRSAQRPLLLRIEDLHWADPAILDHAAELAGTVARCPALLVLTTRIAGDPFDEVWRQRANSSAVAFLDLGPLGKVEADNLAHNFSDVEDGLMATCVDRAGGNPLFLEQLLRNAGEMVGGNIPGTVQGIVQARLDAIPPRDRSALQAASVLGQRFTLPAVHAVAGLVDFRPDRLLAAALIRPVGGGYLFGHVLIRDGAYASLLTQRRRELHRKAADWFAGRDALLHATHLDKAEDPGAGAAYLEAAREFADGFRYDDALSSAERGAEVAPSPGLRSNLELLRGDVLRDAGRTDASIEAFRAALATAPDDVARCRALIGIAAGQRVLGQAEETLATLDEAQPLAQAQSLSLELARIHQVRGNIAFLKGDVDLCQSEQHEALRHARIAGSAEIEAQAYSGLGDGDYITGRMLSAHGNFERASEIARAHGLLGVEAACVPAVAHTLVFQNKLTEARETISVGLKQIQRVGQFRAEVIVRLSLGSLLCEFLDPRAGLEQAETAAVIARRIGARVWEPLAWSVRGRCLAYIGDTADAVMAARRGVEMARETSRALLGAWAAGCLAWVSDDEDEQRAALREGEAMLEGRVVGHCHLWFYRDAIETCLGLGDRAAAGRYADLLEDFTRDEPLPWSNFFIARGRAIAAFAETPDDPAILDRITALREEAERIGMGTALPRILRALGC